MSTLDIHETKKPIKACIFDMDGLLIDSESVYTKATNEILRRYGKPDLPMSVKLQMMGRLGPAAAQVLIDWAELPLTPAEYFAEQSTIQTPMWPKIQILPGVLQLIIHLSEKKIPIAIATSSTTANYRLKLNHLEILTSKFDAIVTGDCDLMKGRRGKPKGDIFLLALEMLGLEDVRPNECLVFEDSVPGVEAAKDAGMNVIWVPDPRILEEVWVQKDEILGSNGEILMSLENFPLKKYGFF